ncbi:MAG: SDR family oxidoreductase [Ruminococcaceae bacterium]|nr:SDR family oxidoreductase [Oscillospiraceae bacterium]
METDMKLALITGGSRGIGREITRLFAAKGYKTIFLYNNSADAASSLSKECGAIGLRCDVSDPAEAEAACREIVNKYGCPDVLVNNAGVSYIGLFTDMSINDWYKVINTNLSAVFFFSKEIAKGMVSRHSGRIINIGSVWGNYGASCEAAYSASKAGVRGFTSALAKELGPSGITVNCVEPGVIMTDMCADFDGQTLDELKNSTSLCRLGTPADVANAVYFLASDEASFITGQFLGVDGGFPFG